MSTLPHLSVGGLSIPLDEEGFLERLEDWNHDSATALAMAEGIELSDAHWEVINTVREFYREFEHAPANRALVKYVKIKLGADKGRSIYLLKLFPDRPALLVAKIAGLPRPDNCF